MSNEYLAQRVQDIPPSGIPAGEVMQPGGHLIVVIESS